VRGVVDGALLRASGQLPAQVTLSKELTVLVAALRGTAAKTLGAFPLRHRASLRSAYGRLLGCWEYSDTGASLPTPRALQMARDNAKCAEAFAAATASVANSRAKGVSAAEALDFARALAQVRLLRERVSAVEAHVLVCESALRLVSAR
jgi:hypothetical protein